MIKLETLDVQGFGPAVRGMRNPLESWAKSDSFEVSDKYNLGENDEKLMLKLAQAGPSHCKYRRMITVWVDITAPLYWWKEFDTYKVGTVANSCSTMHKIHAKPFSEDDFSFDQISDIPICQGVIKTTLNALNYYREKYNETKDKKFWYALIQLLPSSYNQKRTVQLNYETLANICLTRQNHKLNEWHKFIEWTNTLPYPELFNTAG